MPSISKTVLPGLLKTAEIMAAGNGAISARDALVKAKHHFRVDVEDLINSGSVEEFMKLVKPEVHNKLRKFFVDQARAKPKAPSMSTPAVSKPGPAQGKSKKMMTLEDLLK